MEWSIWLFLLFYKFWWKRVFFSPLEEKEDIPFKFETLEEIVEIEEAGAWLLFILIFSEPGVRGLAYPCILRERNRKCIDEFVTITPFDVESDWHRTSTSFHLHAVQGTYGPKSERRQHLTLFIYGWGNRIELVTYRGVIHDPRHERHQDGKEGRREGEGSRAQRRSDFLYKKAAEHVSFLHCLRVLLSQYCLPSQVLRVQRVPAPRFQPFCRFTKYTTSLLGKCPCPLTLYGPTSNHETRGFQMTLITWKKSYDKSFLLVM